MLPLVASAETTTTNNLLNQNFDSNAWSGTATNRHGSYEVAAHHGQYIESTISLSNTLTEDQIKYGWTSTLGADIWHWNDATSETEMIQVITGSDGSVVTQSRKVTLSGCGYVNCGSHQTYTDSHVEGMNGNTDYDIKVRFNFSESTQSSGHWAVDLENPTLVIEYESNPVFLSSAQTAQISTAVDEIEEVKIEDYKFEEVKVEEIKIEDVYVASIDPTMDIKTLDKIEDEIILDIVPVMEVEYDNKTNIEEVSTEVKDFEEEGFNNETADEGIKEIEEEFIADSGGEPRVESNESSYSGGEPTEDQIIGGEPREEPTQEITESNDEERLGETESEVASNDERNGGTQEEPQVEAREENMDNDPQDERSVSISISDVQEKVAEKIKEVDKQIVATQIIVARIMTGNNKMIDSYSTVNQDIFNNQLEIDGGTLDDFYTRDYSDDRDLYAEIQNPYADSMAQYQKKIDDAVANRIIAEENLRRIRGY